MPAIITHKMEERYVEVSLTGKLNKADYELLVPQFEDLIKNHGKLRMLVILDDFHGWTFGGLWEDIKFDAKHFNDVERLGIVGEKQWHKSMAVFCKPFTSAKIRYFEKPDVDTARDWVIKGNDSRKADVASSAKQPS